MPERVLPQSFGTGTGEHHTMEDPGQRLRRRREELNLRYRDVEDASKQIATRRNNNEYEIAISRLSDIETKGTIPSIYKVYSLSAIYRLDVHEVLEWYGVDFAQIPGDASGIEIDRTHALGFQTNGIGEITMPVAMDPGIDIKKTTYLSRAIQRWGKLPLMVLNGLELKNHRYAYVGMEDWFMYPLLQPGAFVMVDETRRKVTPGPWGSEFERPIYFLEYRGGFLCAWCAIENDQLFAIPHPASNHVPQVFSYPQEVDVIGQIVGVAMRLDPPRRARPRP
jgi:transcriptional regulator with XRE-family HTH domain